MEEGVVDIGPELLDHEGECVDADVEAPLVGGVAKGAFAGWVVGRGDSRGSAGADDLAGIEDFTAGVGAGDDDAAKSVAGSLDEASATEGIVAVVLVGEGGNDGFDKEVFGGLVDDGVPEIATVSNSPAAEFGIRIALHVVASDGERYEDGGVIEGVFKGGGELLLGGLGRQLDIGTDGAEVGEYTEDARGLRGRGLVGLRLRQRRIGDVPVRVGAAGRG